MKTKHLPPSILVRGFTLLEIMVVLLIIGLLLAVVAGGLTGLQTSGEMTATDAKVSGMRSMLLAYKTQGGSYPTQGQGLMALHRKPSDPAPKRWVQSIANEKDLNDAWDRPLQYRYPGTHNPTSFDIWSIGPDGQDGTDDDIGNW